MAEMDRLKDVVASMVNDLIEVRGEADRRAADLAVRYRDDEVLSAFAVPKLNISNVTIDLRFALCAEEAVDDAQRNESKADSPDDPARTGLGWIGARAREFTEAMLDLPSVRRARLSPRRMANLGHRFEAELIKASIDLFEREEGERVSALAERLMGALKKSGVQLRADDADRFVLRVADFDVGVVHAEANPRSGQADPRPKLILGASALETVDPNLISSIKFDVDLGDARWMEIEEADGSVSQVLRED